MPEVTKVVAEIVVYLSLVFGGFNPGAVQAIVIPPSPAVWWVGYELAITDPEPCEVRRVVPDQGVYSYGVVDEHTIVLWVWEEAHVTNLAITCYDFTGNTEVVTRLIRKPVDWQFIYPPIIERPGVPVGD